MKKKFVLVLALVCLVATSAFAGDPTPVTVSGKVRFGYDLTFGNGTKINGTKPANNVYINSLGIAGDFWKVGVADLFANGFDLDDDWLVTGYGELYFDKLAKAAGKDWGKFTLTVGGGLSKNTLSAPHVYADPNGTVSDNSYARLRMIGEYSGYAILGYDFISAYIGISPTLWVDHEDALGATVKKQKAFMASVKVTPIDGIAFTAGYAGYAQRKARSVEKRQNGAIGGSVVFDIKKLASMDFDLKVSAIDTFYLKDDTLDYTTNDMMASVSFGMESWAAYVEYQLFGRTTAKDNTMSNIVAKFTYKGLKNWNMYGKVSLNDLSNSEGEKKMNTAIAAGVEYTYAPATFHLEASCKLYSNSDTKATFTLSPYIQLAF